MSGAQRGTGVDRAAKAAKRGPATFAKFQCRLLLSRARAFSSRSPYPSLHNNDAMASRRTRPNIRHLIVAIQLGDIKLVEYLLAQGTNVNGKHWDDWHSTPSSCAISKNHTQILRLLIRHGLRLQRGEDGPFLQAAFYQNQDSLKLLSRTVFAPELWRGKTRGDRERGRSHLPQHPGQPPILARSRRIISNRSS